MTFHYFRIPTNQQWLIVKKLDITMITDSYCIANYFFVTIFIQYSHFNLFSFLNFNVFLLDSPQIKINYLKYFAHFCWKFSRLHLRIKIINALGSVFLISKIYYNIMLSIMKVCRNFYLDFDDHIQQKINFFIEIDGSNNGFLMW